MAEDRDFPGFVREHVRSVWALELLLLLRSDPERCWAAGELVRELRASKRLVGDNLARFERGGIVVHDDRGCWAYRPAGQGLRQLVDTLEAAYRERPVSIINMITQPADPLQSLADAFRFRGDGK